MTNFATSTNLCLNIIKYRFTDMKTVNWFQEIPDIYRNTPFNITISFEVENGAKVKKNDIVAICKSSAPKFEFRIYSPCDGYYYVPPLRTFRFNPEDHIELRDEALAEGYSYEEFIDDWYRICGVCTTWEEWCEEEYKFFCEVDIDSVTHSQEVRCSDYCIARVIYDDYEQIDDLEECCCISMGLKENRPSLTLIYPQHFKIKIKKGDTLYFCDDQSSYLGLTALCGSSARGYMVAIDFNLLEDDVNALCDNDFKKIVIVHKDGRQRHTIENVWVRDFGYEALNQKTLAREPSCVIFKRFINTYKRALQETGFSFEKETQDVNVTDVELDPCFVYLMCDSKNGYHKIGISKTPEYRERTLQSEKPTIEMVCAKEYPSRKIAEAIESALHKVYERERIRGEWFNLSKADVMMIQKTLE